MIVKVLLPFGLVNYLNRRFGTDPIADRKSWLGNRIPSLVNYTDTKAKRNYDQDIKWLKLELKEELLICPPAGTNDMIIYMDSFCTGTLYQEVCKLFYSELFEYCDNIMSSLGRGEVFSFAAAIRSFSDVHQIEIDNYTVSRSQPAYKKHIEKSKKPVQRIRRRIDVFDL